jgi:glucokinase
MKAIAIDLGGSHATVGILDDQNLVDSAEISLDCADGLASALPLMANATRDLLRKHTLHESDCYGIALSFCGLADASTGKVVSTNQKFDDAIGLDLPGWARDEFGLDFAIENDARMALLGEWFAGSARGTDDAVMITLGTGIGGAAMMNGQLVRGKHVQGGCLGGHLPALFSGRRCTCGAIGCSEAEASGWALPLIAQEWPGFAGSALSEADQVNFRALFECASQGDSVAVAIQERCLRVWAATAVGLIHAYDPEIVIFGGGVMRSSEKILPFIQEYVCDHAWTPWGTVKVVAAELGNHAGLFGAIPLLKQVHPEKTQTVGSK